MKTKENFVDFYENCLKEAVLSVKNQELTKYLKKRTIGIISTFIILLGGLLFSYYLYSNNFPKYYVYIILGLVIILVNGLIIINNRSLRKSKKESCYIVNAFIYDQILYYLSNDNYIFKMDTVIDKADFIQFNLFNLNYLKYTGGNFSAITYNDRKMVFCDICLYDLMDRIKFDSYYSKKENTIYKVKYHYKEKIDIFNGLYFETPINRENNQYIYMIPNNINDKFVQTNIYHYISYKGTKIELENLDFSERYSVFSVDEINSRYILSLTMMEKINKLDSIIKNKKYIVFKPNGRVGIFIDNYQIDNILSREFDLKNGINNKYLTKFFVDVKKLSDIAEIMEDINSYQ